MVWVRPGAFEENARRRRPASALIALDLPTLERPTNATSGTPSVGNSSSVPAEARNVARENSRSGSVCIGAAVGVDDGRRFQDCGAGKNSNRITRFDRYPGGR